MMFGRLAIPGVVILAAGLASPPRTAPSERPSPKSHGKARYLGLKVARPGVSPPLRALPAMPLERAPRVDREDGGGGIEIPILSENIDPVDPLVQRRVGAGEIPAPGLSIDGLGNIGNLAPPDPVGDVGPNHYVLMSNIYFAVYNKAGTLLAGPLANNILWSGFGGPCETQNLGDPIVLYDQLADRWLLTQVASMGLGYLCVAVSATSDPLGSFHLYAFPTTSFPDEPKYGIWPDAYYVGVKQSTGVGVFALNRAQMIAGAPADVISFFLSPGAAPYDIGDGLIPADLDGSNPPPAGSPAFYLGSMDDGGPYGAPQDALTLWKFHVDFAVPGNSTFTMESPIPVAPFDSIFPCTAGGFDCIPQPDTTNKLDLLSHKQRPVHRVAYRNFGSHESLVASQSVEASTSIAGIRWYEIRDPGGTPTVAQQGTYAPGTTDGIHRWMGSVAMDTLGDIALGFSASDATTTYPSVRYTGRLAGDPAGTLPQGEGSFVVGTGSQTGSHRWGDYTSLNVDPVDDCTFWYAGEYVPVTSSNGWRIRIGNFRFPGCHVASIPAALEVDEHASSRPTALALNGVFEPGETALVEPAYRNGSAAVVPVTGMASNFTGPVGAAYTLVDASADYGSIGPGGTGGCQEATGNCYAMSIDDPVSRPAPHWDASFDETLSTGVSRTWTLHIGASFDDVPTGHQFYRFIESIFHAGVTGGCGGGLYCPGNPALRRQMAVFLLKARLGSDYVPPAAVGVFDDVPASDPFAPWIEDLYGRGITGGCSAVPLEFCPDDPVLRQQMAVFLLKTLLGPGYVPPGCSGVFTDVPCPSTFADWIEDLAARGITGGCGGGNFCPSAPNTRGQMAVFLSKTFGIELYAP